MWAHTGDRTPRPSVVKVQPRYIPPVNVAHRWISPVPPREPPTPVYRTILPVFNTFTRPMGSAHTVASRNISKPVNTAITYRSNGKVYTQSASQVIAQRDSVASSVKQTVSQSVNSPISPRVKAHVARGKLNTKVETLSKAFTPVKGSLANKVKGVCGYNNKQIDFVLNNENDSALEDKEKKEIMILSRKVCK